METKLWPGDNPAADQVLMSFLDRVRPGWTIATLVPVSGPEAMDALWPWGERFKGREARPGTPMGEIAVDRALEALAAGEPFPWSSLDAAAEATLLARLLVALTGATYAGLEAEQTIMRLPPGLSPDEQSTAIALRLLYQAPLSLEGL